MMLTSQFEMWLGWGDDLCIFYNDAYIPPLEVKHPWALGEPFREVWKEVYADVADQVRSVMIDGVPTWNKALQLLLERNRYPEEIYHTFSYSPLRERDAIRGLMCIATEETERVISERRLDTVRRLGERLIGTMSQEAVLQGVCDALASNTEDFPFSLAYVRDPLGGLIGCAATDEARPLLHTAWALEEAVNGGQDFPLDGQVAPPSGARSPGSADQRLQPCAGDRRPARVPAAAQAVLGRGPFPYTPADTGGQPSTGSSSRRGQREVRAVREGVHSPASCRRRSSTRTRAPPGWAAARDRASRSA